jgi:glycosyltransferase involved in cell wall biosynthesis
VTEAPTPLTTRVLVAVVPALNEASTVGGVVKAALDHVDYVVVVDDGSTDDTAIVAADAGAIVVFHPRRLGVGAAIASGLARAEDLGATAVVQVDGDGQHNAAYIPAVVAPLLDGADLVVGTRFEHGFEMSRTRRVVLAGFARLISYRLGTKVADPTSGFRAFSRRAVEVLTPVFPLKYLSDTVEVLYLAADHGLRVRTVPVEMTARVAGKPSAGLLRSIGYAVRMMGIVASHTFAHHRRVTSQPTETAASS